MRKETRATEKRKKLIPIKKYKVKVVEKPESNNTTMQPPATTSKVPTDLESQKPSQEGTSVDNPQPIENFPVNASTPWPEAGKISGNIFELRKDWSIPSNNNNTTTIPKPPIKIEP